MAHTDISQVDWVSRFLPSFLQPYARLMRIDRPIGIWLLLWPCLWGAVAAAPDGMPPMEHVVLFIIGAVVMRSAGCVINDLCDRELDQKVERTKLRPLASGALGPKRAVFLLGILLAIGLLILLQFNALTICIGATSLVLVLLYPYAKRFTYWPQFILGLTFNWGALLGWTAQEGHLAWPAILLYAAGIFWTLGYDTIYAHQDKEDDLVAGVKSLALYLGEKSRLWVGIFYALCLVLVIAAGFSLKLNTVFLAVMLLPLMQVGWQIHSWQPDNPVNCLKRFRSNRGLGLLILIVLMAGKLL